MPVIWGFNLSEMSWGAFRHRQMFDKQWYLRRERFVSYKLAMLICLAAQCTATYSMFKYEIQRIVIEDESGDTALVHNTNLTAAVYLTIVFCAFVATLFGADFFFLLFWPARIYPRWYNTTRQALAVGITAGVGAAAVMSTIVVLTGHGYITGVSAEQAKEYITSFSTPPMIYRTWAANVVYVVLLWIGFVFTLLSTILMFMVITHDNDKAIRAQIVLAMPDSTSLKEVPTGDKEC